MRTRRNTFSLIGRLPLKILSRIFSFHAINQPPPTDDIHYDLSPGLNRLELSWITRTSPDDEATLRRHLSRIQRLVLSGYPKYFVSAVRALTTPAPHLESLELLLDARYELCVTLPSDLFAHNAPKLRHVTLSGCALPWDSPLFRGLTHLDIHIPPHCSINTHGAI
jgi:hypothetical protein